MRYDKKCKLDVISKGTEASRYAMQAPWLSRGLGKAALMATNGKVLAVVPVDSADEDTEGSVPVEAIEAYRKKEGSGIALNGTARVMPSGAEFRRMDVTPPDAAAIVKCSARDRVGFQDLCLDAGELERLFAALGRAKGTTGVMLRIATQADGTIDESAPVFVHPMGEDLMVSENPALDGSEAFGLIMPIASKEASKASKASKAKKDGRTAGRAASPSPSISDAVDSVDAEEGAAIAREGGANA